MATSLTILGSGSNGNAAYLEVGQTRILVDAGLSGRQIRQRLAGIGRSPETLTAILITHEHGDHVQGLAALAGKLQIPVYANRFTKEAVQESLEVPVVWRVFETGAVFEVGDARVESFSIPHDAQDPVGFMIETADGRAGFLTDLGHATRLAVERVKRARVLVLESNHDVKLLQDNPNRPWSLKQRILSRHGHLSNEAAADVAREVVWEGMERLFLGHLSRDCNRPELALGVMNRCLAELGATHVAVEVTCQNTPCATVTF